MNPGNFFAELKRRNVYKVAVAYAVVGWLLIQVATQVFPFFEIPNWAVRLVVLAIVLGFPIALVIAWAFELTPEGIKRTDEVAETRNRRGGRAWIYVVLVGAGLSAGLFFLGRCTASGPGAAGASEKSIAVLPLVNQSGDPAQEYFSDGLSEELINGLGKIAELRVIGRNSSFHFKGKTGDSRAIGQALGVAHLLEGSVRKAGDRVRIGLQLVNAGDGSQRWSETYDRELKDIFAVQEEIAKTVAEQLRVRLLGGAASIASQPSNQNLVAYNLFLEGRAEYAKANPDALRRAISLLDQAIALDPNYAEAYVTKAGALTLLAFFDPDPRTHFEKARSALRTALALKPDLSQAHANLAAIHIGADWNFPAAEAELAIAREKDAMVLNILGHLRLVQGRWDESTALRREVIRLEPLHATYYLYLAQNLSRAERWQEAEAMLRKALEVQPSVSGPHVLLAVAAIVRGDLDAALREAELEPAASLRAGALAYVRFARGEREQSDEALAQLIANFGEQTPVTVSAVYAFRREPDRMFEWLERAYQRREPFLLSNLPLHPFYKPYYSDPRFVALCQKIGMPVPK